MTDDGTPTEDTGIGETDSTGDAAGQPPRSVEEVEAYYRARQSGIDRAHNAETASLKAQIAALQGGPASAPPAGETAEAVQVRQLTEELARVNAARQAESLRSQYPYAAGVLGDSLTSLPPEKLDAIEALGDNGTRRVDPNMAPRQRTGVQSQAQRPLSEKSKEELLADLKRTAPAFQEAMREGLR